MAHTSGPWTVSSIANDQFLQYKLSAKYCEQHNIKSDTPEYAVALCAFSCGYSIASAKNAELLEALEDLVTLIDFVANEYDLSKMSETKAARAAIAKAKGEDQ